MKTKAPSWVTLAQDAIALNEVHGFAAVAPLPEGMVSLHVPPGSYARFEHRGPAPRIDHTVSYAYATWLAQSGRRHTYAPDLEIYGAGYHPTNDDSVFHYAIPISDP